MKCFFFVSAGQFFHIPQCLHLNLKYFLFFVEIQFGFIFFSLGSDLCEDTRFLLGSETVPSRRFPSFPLGRVFALDTGFQVKDQNPSEADLAGSSLPTRWRSASQRLRWFPTPGAIALTSVAPTVTIQAPLVSLLA